MCLPIALFVIRVNRNRNRNRIPVYNTLLRFCNVIRTNYYRCHAHFSHLLTIAKKLKMSKSLSKIAASSQLRDMEYHCNFVGIKH